MIREKFTNERGQVGIGTLIVFIALVLVAAIAAGVLINTAGFLQTQAEETGTESTDQVADNINVIGQVGEANDPDATQNIGSGDNTVSTSGNPEIYENRLTVQRSPGSGEIDLTGLSIQYVGDNGFAQLTHVSNAEVDDGGTAKLETDEQNAGAGADVTQNVYFVRAVTAESETDAVITDDGDRYEIIIPLGGYIKPQDGTDAYLVPNTDTDIGGTGALVSLESYTDSADAETDFVTRLNNEGTAGNGFAEQIDNTDLGLLTEGQTAELEITTDSGATRNVVLTAPDTTIDQDGDTVTL